jgi:hypothetical protein
MDSSLAWDGACMMWRPLAIQHAYHSCGAASTMESGSTMYELSVHGRRQRLEHDLQWYFLGQSIFLQNGS